MAEGRNPSLGCGWGCVGSKSGWVPFPASKFPRRNPLLDAYRRTEDPCDRPKRGPPCCSPTPRFRLPMEKPECDINCYRKEQNEAQWKEYYEQRQKYMDRYCPCPPPELIIESLDPENYPIAVERPPKPNPHRTWVLKEQPVKTDIIAGFFNPNDNKDFDQIQRERCDPFYKECASGPPEYPCRGVISYPRQKYVNLAEEQKLVLPEGCKGSKYLEPEYMEKMLRLRCEIQAKRQQERDQLRADMIASSGYVTPHPCCSERLSQTPYCTCNDNFC